LPFSHDSNAVDRSGDIYQVCKVFRAGEAGPKHNPEFTLVEWYRLGFGLAEVIDETVELIKPMIAFAGPELLRLVTIEQEGNLVMGDDVTMNAIYFEVGACLGRPEG
jgi:elongation factor P--beta-lysine ligase